MSSCIRCGREIDSGGLVCYGCRQKLDYPPTAIRPHTGDEQSFASETPFSKPQNDVKIHKDETIKIKPVPGEGTYIESKTTPPIPKPASQAPATAGTVNQPSAKSPAPKKTPLTREELQKEDYKKLLAEYEKSKNEHNKDEDQKKMTDQKTGVQSQPQPVYMQQQGQQQYQGQYPNQYPQQSPPPQQYGAPPSYQYPQQRQGGPQGGGDVKVCKRCGHTNDRWRLSCEKCKSSLG